MLLAFWCQLQPQRPGEPGLGNPKRYIMVGVDGPVRNDARTWYAWTIIHGFHNETPRRSPPRDRDRSFPRSSVGMPSATLRVARLASLSAEDAERPGRHSHAERGNEGTCFTGQGYVEEWRSARSLLLVPQKPEEQ